MQPLKNNVMVEMETLSSGIIQVQSQDKTNIAKVIAVGPDVVDEDIRVGVKVIMPGTVGRDAPDAWVLVPENELMGVLCD
jgi:co-chaperonin GroES (HSP10)